MLEDVPVNRIIYDHEVRPKLSQSTMPHKFTRSQAQSLALSPSWSPTQSPLELLTQSLLKNPKQKRTNDENTV